MVFDSAAEQAIINFYDAQQFVFREDGVLPDPLNKDVSIVLIPCTGSRHIVGNMVAMSAMFIRDSMMMLVVCQM